MEKINHARKYAKDFNILTRLYQLYALYILYIPIFGLFYKFKCTRTKLENKPYIFAANHISYCDPFLMNMVTVRSLAYMASAFSQTSWLLSLVICPSDRLSGQMALLLHSCKTASPMNSRRSLSCLP